MKSGDMIEWAYVYDNIVVHKDEELWSSSMDKWVPIGEPSFLISITKDHYMWVNSNGLFHACIDDMRLKRGWDDCVLVVPRTV